MFTCKLQLEPGESGEINLSFILTNNGWEPRTLTYFYPFLDFTLTVFAAGRPLRVEEPEYDIGIRPTEQRLLAGQSFTLHTPATLRFMTDEGDEAGQFCWLIHAPPQPIEIEATLNLGVLETLSCQSNYPTVS